MQRNFIRYLKRLFVLVTLFNFSLHANANNLEIFNTALLPVNDISGSVYITFDIKWENSFRMSYNGNRHDAAWVFAKYRVAVASGGDGVWRHASLSTNANHNFIKTAVTDIKKEGVFIYRADQGFGNINIEGIKLYWNYQSHKKATNGKQVILGDAIEIQLFGIEMIYVGGDQPFQVGGNGVNAFTPTWIRSGDASTAAAGFPTGIANSNSNFPNGFLAFYCMKYEISQQQYVDFLNTLTYAQQQTRTALSPASASATSATPKFGLPA